MDPDIRALVLDPSITQALEAPTQPQAIVVDELFDNENLLVIKPDQGAGGNVVLFAVRTTE